MELKEVIKILEQHNKWRRCENFPSDLKMVEPKILGQAIDEAISELKKLSLSDVGYPLCACGGNERIAMDCTRKKCEHPKYSKSST